MNKSVKSILGSLVIAGSLSAMEVHVNSGWQLLGAVNDINTSNFDNNCVDYVWKYNNNEWKLYVSNGVDISGAENYTVASQFNQGEGFWVKASSDCMINIGEVNIAEDNTTKDSTICTNVNPLTGECED
ncbi:MAG: hypothetical protein JXQ66_05480 [Campylobacterales bacterium]|nr:hypothetical protein [Campylobacterales bacterium]